MASPEFVAYQAHLAANAAPLPDDLTERRAAFEAAAATLPIADGCATHPGVVGGVDTWRCRPEGADDLPVVAYFHGGGYRMGSARGYRSFGSRLAMACRAEIVVADYALAPERPYPAAVDDAVAVVSGLLDSGVAPGRLVIGGDSAGGGLAASTLVALRERGLPQPAAAFCLSPWADLRNTAESFTTNASTDRLFSLAHATAAVGVYLDGRPADDPLVSPVLADWTGLAPVLVQAGDREVLLDDAFGLFHAARRGGVDAQLEVYAEMPHVWHLAYPAYPEAVQAVERVAAFIAARVT